MPTVNLTLTGQALSKVDDTNVTLTLGGTPLTALLKATSITVGWTGQLSVARGGTGLGALGTANQLLRVNALGTALEYFTPTYGSGTVTSVSVVSANGLAGTVANATTTPAITLSTSINSPVLAGNGTALIAATTTGSGSTVVLSTSPTFVTDISAPKIISSTASGGLLLCNNNGVTVASFGVGSAGSTNIALIGATAVTGTISGTSSLTLGTASANNGSIVFQNSANANTITFNSGTTAGSYSLTLPTAQGGANTYLKNDGTGVLSWAAAGGVAGSDTQVQYNDGGTQAGDADFTWNKTTNVLNVTGGYNINSVKFANQYETALNLSIGYLSGQGSTMVLNTFDANRAYNTLVGIGAGNAISGFYAGQNTALGYEALKSTGGGGNPENYQNTAIGFRALGTWAAGTGYNVAVGYRAGYGTGSTLRYATFLGYQAGDGSAFNSVIAIGANATPTAANQCIIGATGAASGNGVIDNVYFNGVTHTSAASIILNACGGSGTNNAGANITLAGGKGTGTAAGGTYKSQTSVKGSSGTTLQSLTDRHTVPAKYVDITGGAATTFGQLALATSSTNAGGEMLYTIHASDGTDTQSLTGVLKYDVVNKAGTLTVTYSDVQNGAGACSAGTLTATVTATTSGTNVLFQANAVSSLVETVLRISFQVLNQFGVATITAA